MVSLRGLAMLYACGVVLAAPVTLHADDVKTTPDETEPAQTTETAPAPPPAPPPAAPAPAPAATPAPAAAPPAAPAPAPAPTQPEPASKPRATASASGTVQMRDFSFSPATITVNVGDSVTWVNSGEEPHNAVGDGFSTALLDAGESASESFSSAGTFSYICTVHPQMKGTVKVEGAAAQTDDGADDAGTPSSGNAGAGTADTTPDQATGPQLADSGLDAWLLALAGVAMLAAGIALRDRLARID